MNFSIPAGFEINNRRGPYTNHNGPFYINTSADPWLHGVYIIERHCNAAQMAHGGMLMSFADGILGHAVYKKTQRGGVTIKFNAEFLSAVRLGEWMEGYAVVNSVKDNFVYCEAILSVSTRRVLSVTSIFKLRSDASLKKIIKKRR